MRKRFCSTLWPVLLLALAPEELGFVQDTATGKTVTFASSPTSQGELEQWLEAEIARKLAATEADNSLAEEEYRAIVDSFTPAVTP